MKEEKQIVRVLDVVRDGARTSIEASSLTGLSVKHCSAYLHELELCGLVRRIGKRRFKKSGIPATEYVPSEATS